ncbi:MAG TPA: alpha/beta fold hydrolase [Chroococcales cyanobacterium]|jgi:carboxylesterase
MLPIGVLLLHGFTSSLDTVNGLVPCLERDHIPYRMPLLRGHGSRPEALLGVTSRDWFVDARAALFDLLKECDKVVVVGLSMGGVVALQLAMEHPEQLAGVVPVAAALEFRDPLTRLTPLLGKIRKFWPSPKLPKKASYRSTNYPYFPLDSFISLQKYGREMRPRLKEINIPILVIGSRKDTVVPQRAAETICAEVSSTEKQLRWFDRSGHEMLQDCEHEAVYAAIEEFILKKK